MNAARTIPTPLAQFTERLLGAGLTVEDYELVHDGVGGSIFYLYLGTDGYAIDDESYVEYTAYADSMDHGWYLVLDPTDVLLDDQEVVDTLTAIATTVKEQAR
jgi:hypothetical protein